MKLLGVERYAARGYGVQEVSYYAAGEHIEERQLAGRGVNWIVVRYVGIDADAMQAIAAKIGALSKKQAASARGHNELRRLLDRFPNVSGYVDLDEIDKPGRKVTVAWQYGDLPRGTRPEDVFRLDGVQEAPPLPVHYFGCCPVCHAEGLIYHVGPDEYVVCPDHKLAWWIGSALFDVWRSMTEGQFDESRRFLEGCEMIEQPYCTCTPDPDMAVTGD